MIYNRLCKNGCCIFGIRFYLNHSLSITYLHAFFCVSQGSTHYNCSWVHKSTEVCSLAYNLTNVMLDSFHRHARPDRASLYTGLEGRSPRQKTLNNVCRPTKARVGNVNLVLNVRSTPWRATRIGAAVGVATIIRKIHPIPLLLPLVPIKEAGLSPPMNRSCKYKAFSLIIIYL